MRPLLSLVLAGLLLATTPVPPGPALSARAAPGQESPPALADHIRALLGESSAALSFYQRRAYQPAWEDNDKGRTALALLAQAQDYGLQPRQYHVTALQALADSLTRFTIPAKRVKQQARFEVLLTEGLLRFALHLRRGQLRAFTPSPLEKAGGPFEPAAWLTQALKTPNFAVALLRCQPANREYQQLQQALVRWRRHPGRRNAQWHRRAEQIALNLERWRWTTFSDATYVLVNLPAYRLEVVRHRRVAQVHRVVIGRPAYPTPTLSSRLASFTVAPEWRVPHRIATGQILPYLQANARVAAEHDFLADNNYCLYDAQGRAVNPAGVDWLAVTAQNFPYTIRQNPGCGNLLGNFVFPFANPYGLYLNDGPDPARFARPYRALGRSCLHLEHPRQLAAFLLGPAAARSQLPSEAECEAAPTPRSFFLKRPMPLHVRYATCAVVAGKLRFYADGLG